MPHNCSNSERRRRSDASTKKLSQRAHARKRARERYQLDFTAEVRQHFISTIYANAIVSSRRVSNRCRDMVIEYESKLYRVIYDSFRKEIVTFLPHSKPSSCSALAEALSEQNAIQQDTTHPLSP